MSFLPLDRPAPSGPGTQGLRSVQGQRPDAQAQRDELLQGLTQPRASVPSKYLYDTLGSRLFEAITELPEYGLTRAEQALFARHAGAMRRPMPDGFCLVDLGAGNCRKAAALLARWQPAAYVAVDISVAFLDEALQVVQALHPGLPVLGLGLDFSAHLVLDPAAVPEPRVLFYPGSSIGNFAPPQALAFLRQARAQCGGGGLLVGVDLHKGAERLLPAYDDALRVTSAFNRNLLRHVNRVLGSDFAVADWRHVAFFDEQAGCIEMQLQALRSAPVGWPGGGRRFAAGERILTEQSYKWRLSEFQDLLEAAGFGALQTWVDADAGYAVCWAAA